ncbi:MAG TPA: TonB-dependent receptor [Terriglobales bacterium]|nr:TonB-dependent receptor [Terriglobales bacterium]
MSTRRLLSLALSLCVFAGLSISSHVALAQEVTASIVGTITDPSGAPIKDATVVATDTNRGTLWSARTNDTGGYNLLRLPIGSYTVKVSATGFDTAIRPAFTLQLNQTARVDVQMKVGQISESVEVTSEAPVLQTENAQVGTVIDSATTDNLPLETRNYVQLTLLSPGSISVDPSSMNQGSNTAEEGGRPYINGNREQSNNFLLDGIDNNQASDNLLGYTPSPDAIAEFNVINQNASAEFGNYNGGIVNATIKSGTNSFHGDVFEYFRNDIFNANKWENGLGAGTPTGVLPTPKLRWNMFGGTLGGPIIKNKLFFFADYQGGRLDHPSSSSPITVLTAAETAGDFSGLTSPIYNPCAAGTGGTSGVACNILAPASRPAFSGNVIPSNMLDPAFTALVTSSLYPKSLQTLSSGFGQAVNTTAQQYNSDQGDIKVDFKPNDKDSAFVRFSKGNQYDPSSNSVALLGNSVNEAYLLNGSANWTHSFGSNLLNEVRFGKNNVRLATGLASFNSAVGQLGNTIGIANGNPGTLVGLPSMSFGGGSGTNPNAGALNTIGNATVVQRFNTTVTQFDDVLLWTHGRQTIRTGFQVNRYNLNVFYSGNGGELGLEIFGLGPGGNYSGNGANGDPAADWALGLPQDVARGTSGGGWHQRDWLYAGFVQDDWRISSGLTLNLGLRYEARTPWTETNGRQDSVNIFTGEIEFSGNTPVPAGVVGSNGFSNALYKSDYGLLDFQPRLGFAWSPKSGKTVVRGAFDVSSYLEGTGTNLRLTQNPPFTPPQVEASNVATGTAYNTESAFSKAAPPAGNPFIGATLLAWSGTVQPAVSDQWNLSVQRQIANNTTVQLGYVGQRTTHLMVPEWLAQGDLVNGTVVYPFIGGKNSAASGLTGFGPNQLGNVKNTASVGNMNYNALQAVLHKRYSNGLEAQVSYTFQKCMTNDDGYYGTWGGAKLTTASGNYWQNLYNPNGDYAQCYWDSKHVISAYAVYEIPFGKGKRFGSDAPAVVNAVAGNWSINPIVSMHTGFPLSLYGSDFSGTGTPESRPDCIGPVQYPKTVSNAGMQWFGASAFANAAPGTFGNCPAQGPVIGPGFMDFDISMQKNFPIGERMKFQFRTDFLNIFNHPNLAAPNTSFGGGMGLISTSQDARQLQFALKFYF